MAAIVHIGDLEKALIGSGAYGCAYRTDDGRILKIFNSPPGTHEMHVLSLLTKGDPHGRFHARVLVDGARLSDVVRAGRGSGLSHDATADRLVAHCGKKARLPSVPDIKVQLMDDGGPSLNAVTKKWAPGLKLADITDRINWLLQGAITLLQGLDEMQSMDIVSAKTEEPMMIVHNDIKSDNIVCGTRENPSDWRFIDWGISVCVPRHVYASHWLTRLPQGRIYSYWNDTRPGQHPPETWLLTDTAILHGCPDQENFELYLSKRETGKQSGIMDDDADAKAAVKRIAVKIMDDGAGWETCFGRVTQGLDSYGIARLIVREIQVLTMSIITDPPDYKQATEVWAQSEAERRRTEPASLPRLFCVPQWLGNMVHGDIARRPASVRAALQSALVVDDAGGWCIRGIDGSHVALEGETVDRMLSFATTQPCHFMHMHGRMLMGFVPPRSETADMLRPSHAESPGLSPDDMTLLTWITDTHTATASKAIEAKLRKVKSNSDQRQLRSLREIVNTLNSKDPWAEESGLWPIKSAGIVRALAVAFSLISPDTARTCLRRVPMDNIHIVSAFRALMRRVKPATTRLD